MPALVRAINVASSVNAINGGANQITLTSATPIDNIIVSVETGASSSTTNSSMVVADSDYQLRLPSPQTTIVLTIVLPVQVARQAFVLEYSGGLVVARWAHIGSRPCR